MNYVNIFLNKYVIDILNKFLYKSMKDIYSYLRITITNCKHYPRDQLRQT